MANLLAMASNLLAMAEHMRTRMHTSMEHLQVVSSTAMVSVDQSRKSRKPSQEQPSNKACIIPC